MRFRFASALLGAVLIFGGVTVGQDKEPKETKETKETPAARPAAYPVEVRFADDSSVKAALQDKTVEITTRYGKLTVPVEEIRSIDLGMRVPPETAKRIQAAIGKLGSQVFAEREAASAELIELRELAYPALQQASHSNDAEVAKRAKEAIKTLGETVPSDKLHPPQHDTVVALDFTIIGHIESPTLKARTPYFGETTLKLAEVRSLRWGPQQSDSKLSVDAARYGAQTEAWLDTGIKLRAGAGLQVAATGTVDMRPSDPGNMVAGPDGRGGGRGGRGGFAGGGGVGGGGRGFAGRGGSLQSPGTLVGRIGEYGRVFVIGSQFDGTSPEEGKLYLRILPSASGEESVGTYEVRVTAGR
jgi:uncharacterized membrane protein YgcG